MVGKVFPQGDKLMVNGVDALTGQTVIIDADMVVLAAATKAKDDTVALIVAVSGFVRGCWAVFLGIYGPGYDTR